MYRLTNYTEYSLRDITIYVRKDRNTLRNTIGTIVRSNRVGLAFLGTLVATAFYVWRYIDLGKTELKPILTVPGFATAALSTVGLVSLFVGLLYQRRFQRADELIREISLVRELWHPDYRELHNLHAHYTEVAPASIDPRYLDKHRRTVETVRRFREYRQLFVSAPPYAAAFALALPLTVVAAMGLWLLSLSGIGWPSIIFQAVALAATAESLGQVLQTLWRVSWFSDRGTDAALEGQLGLPSWYRLLDTRYLAGRFLPFAPLVAALECYLFLSSAEGKAGDKEWVLSFQLPLPLREWEWQCEVKKGELTLSITEGWKRVSLNEEEADRFFGSPGLWLQTEVARWPIAAAGPEEFHDVTLTLKMRGVEDSRVLCLRAPAKLNRADGWYGTEPANGPMHYPWFHLSLEGDSANSATHSHSVLVLPPSATLDGVRR